MTVARPGRAARRSRRGRRGARDRARRRSRVALVAAAFHHDLHGAWPFLLAGPARARRLADPVHARGARGRRVADVGHRRRGAARRRRDRARLPRRAAAGAARPRRARRSSRAACCSPPSATGRGTSARIGLRLRGRARRCSSRRATTSCARCTRTRPRDGRGGDAPRGHASSRRSGRGGCRRGASCGASRRPACSSASRYVCLFEAYFRGRVTVVSPLVATESLWGVALVGAPDPRRPRGWGGGSRRGAARRRRRRC